MQDSRVYRPSRSSSHFVRYRWFSPWPWMDLPERELAMRISLNSLNILETHLCNRALAMCSGSFSSCSKTSSMTDHGLAHSSQVGEFEESRKQTPQLIGHYSIPTDSIWLQHTWKSGFACFVFSLAVSSELLVGCWESNGWIE